MKHVGFAKVDSADEGKGYELDVVVEGAGTRSAGRTKLIALGEAKASDRARTVDDLDRLERLREELAKRGELAKRADAGQAKLLLFGHSGFDPDLTAPASALADVELLDLVRLYEGD